MIVSVHGFSARCTDCGGTDFERRGKGTPKLSTRMYCSMCGHSTTYRALLETIGEQAMRRANAAIARLAKTPQFRSKRT
jgi:hypothetical protein